MNQKFESPPSAVPPLSPPPRISPLHPVGVCAFCPRCCSSPSGAAHHLPVIPSPAPPRVRPVIRSSSSPPPPAPPQVRPDACLPPKALLPPLRCAPMRQRRSAPMPATSSSSPLSPSGLPLRSGPMRRRHSAPMPAASSSSPCPRSTPRVPRSTWRMSGPWHGGSGGVILALGRALHLRMLYAIFCSSSHAPGMLPLE